MAGQNRSSYARQSGGGSRGLAFYRGAFMLLVALTFSFALGFFLFAKMVPQNSAQADSGKGPESGQSSAVTGSGSKRNNDTPKEPTVQENANPVVSEKHAPGPSILPAEEVQAPEKVDGRDQTATQDNAVKPGSDTPASNAADENPSVKKGRRSGTEDIQPAGSPDAASTPSTPPANPAEPGARTAPSDQPTVAKSGLYRVQIGVYSTRAKAEEVAASASDKGIATSVRVVTRDGRTLYRVQHSSHRDRAKAEAERQKLIDAGFDASIINPS